MPDNTTDLGSTIRERRSELRRQLPTEYSGRAFAQKIGITPAYLSRIEAGEIVPAADVLEKIARELNISQDVLFALAGKVTPEARNIINQQPEAVMDFLRTIRGMSAAELNMAKEVVKTIRNNIGKGKDGNDSGDASTRGD